MELRPFRALRYTPTIVNERGISRLIAPPSEEITPEEKERLFGRAAENIARVTAADAGAGETLRGWLARGVLWKERRPGLWTYRQTLEDERGVSIVNLLVGLVRLRDSEDDPALPAEEVPAETRARRLGFLGETKADFEPCLLTTRAPLSPALATTRAPDLSAVDDRGVRHDVFRITDYAQHVDLQGRVKHVEVELASGLDRYEAARQFAKGPGAAKLPGARYKLCAIADEAELEPNRPPLIPYSGFFGFSLEDPVY